MDIVPRHEREIACLTLCVSEARIQELKRELEAFRHRIAHTYQADDTPQRVLQINFQLFPLTKARS